MTDSNHAEPAFWNVRYAAQQTPWDLGRVPPALERFLARNPGQGRRVLVPGCGAAHEIPAFVNAGYRVTAIDFSREAIARAQQRYAHLTTVDFICGDFFTAPFPADNFDLVYERTFLCAVPLDRRTDLVSMLAYWTRQGGLYFGLFYYGPKAEGPPFGLEAKEARELFDLHFKTEVDTPVPAEESLPLFAGAERWQERRRRIWR